MLSFFAHPPHRTNISSQQSFTSSDGAVTTEFITPQYEGDNFKIRQTFHLNKIQQIRNTGKEPEIIFHKEIFHWNKSENFTLESGKLASHCEGRFHTYYSAVIDFEAYPGWSHIFEVYSDKENEDGVFTRKLENGEKFFRNLFGYLDDCQKANIKPDIFQILLILHDNQTSLTVPKIPAKIRKFFGKWVLGYIGGKIIGEKILGYRSSYPEYYVERKSSGKKNQ